ncbi:hypothetical protein ACQP2F_45080 [Actinoplanes sp. CA-030573]|uniref:hypothetical protein n=1 Tax=Actinoplanes sp. CA-030573 TaxID=3239898 RepID=UPI003D931D0B
MTAPRVTPVNVADLHPAEVADHIGEVLAALGETPDAIAARLAELGENGYRDAADRCPIANYLIHTVSLVRSVAVLDRVIDLYTWTDINIGLATTDPVADFVFLFDGGRYPQLDASALATPLADPGTTIRKEDRP